MVRLAVAVLLAGCTPPASGSMGAPDASPAPGSVSSSGKPLAELCAGDRDGRCATLAEHLAELRASQCSGKNPTPPTTRACGSGVAVDVDYGIVGYTRFFDAKGVLVGGVAHVYEYRRSERYGVVPECAPGDPNPVCDAGPSPSDGSGDEPARPPASSSGDR